MLNILYTSIARAGGIDVVPGTEIVPRPRRHRVASGAFSAIRAAIDNVFVAVNERASAATRRTVQPAAQ